MDYIEFVETIKSLLGYKGDELEPLSEEDRMWVLSNPSAVRSDYYKTRGYDLSTPLGDAVKIKYEKFLEGIGYEVENRPIILSTDSIPKEGWYISDQGGQKGDLPMVHYIDYEGNYMYVFNPYDLYFRVWFNTYPYSSYYDYEMSKFSTFNLYLGKHLDLKYHFNFMNWINENPLEVKG